MYRCRSLGVFDAYTLCISTYKHLVKAIYCIFMIQKHMTGHLPLEPAGEALTMNISTGFNTTVDSSNWHLIWRWVVLMMFDGGGVKGNWESQKCFFGKMLQQQNRQTELQIANQRHASGKSFR